MTIRPPQDQAEFEARLLGSVAQPIVGLDVEYRVVYWNAGATGVVGYSRDEMMGEDALDRLGIELSDARSDRLFEQLAAGEVVVQDFWVRRRDGSTFPALVTLTPVLDDQEQLLGLVAVGTDITERKAAEETMARLSAIVESSSDAIIGMNLDGTITSWNAAASQLYGYQATETIGQDVRILSIPERRNLVDDVLERVRQGESVTNRELPRLRKDGMLVEVATAVYPILGTEGQPVGAASISRDISVRRGLERVAEQEHRRLEEAQRLAHLGSFEYDVTTRAAEWSRGLKLILGFDEDAEPDYSAFMSRVHRADREGFFQRFAEWTEDPERPFDSEFRYELPGGEIRWLRSRGQLLEGGDREHLVMVGTTQDVTDWRETELARRIAEEQFSVAFERGNVGMLVLDNSRKILRVNPALCRMLGRSAEEMVGATPDDFAHPSEIADAGQSLAERLLKSAAETLSAERRYIRKNGETLWALVHIAVVRVNTEPAYMFAQVVDITDRKKVEEELQRLAMHDPLTGLPNRYLLQDRLETALARAHRSLTRVAVFFVDIDHFKLVNDTLGHASGDSLLVQVAGRLARESREGDTVARFGGDEFVMVCENLTGLPEASAIGERIESLFEEPFLIGEQLLYATVSTGVVLAEPDTTPVTALRDADAAMYSAKERGRARVEVYDEQLHYRAAKRLDIEMLLRHALERDELRVAFQPIVTLPGEVPAGVEALVRWEHPERGLLLPGEFIPAAEETGLIGPIGGWVLDAAVTQLGEWQRTLPGASDLFVAVNLSPRQLIAGDLLARCRDVTTANRVATERLCLEITEGAVMDDVDISIPILRRITDSGIRLAVDDFGAGYSSLSYLKRLPVSVLKIDRSFVDGLGHDPDDSAIVRAIVSLGYALNLDLCAEGVETGAQRAELVGLGCQQAQGYLWAPPMSACDFAAWYSRRLALPEA